MESSRPGVLRQQMENPFKTYFLLEKGGIVMNMFLLLEGKGKAVLFFVFAWLRCVLDDLNNAPGEALSSLLGALTRQERRKIDVEVMARDGPKR